MAVRLAPRAQGMGAVIDRHHGTDVRYWAVQPQTKGQPYVVIAKCPTKWHAERALKAWYVVGAVTLLAQLGGSSARIAS